MKLYKIETKKPYGAKPIRKYLNKDLKKLKGFFDNNYQGVFDNGNNDVREVARYF